MPARRITKCPRHAGADRLGLLDELNLVYWYALLPGSDFPTLDAMRAAWHRHGDAIAANYTRQLPGQRPFAMYALGLLPLPDVKHEPTPGQEHRTIGGARFWPAWNYFGTRTGPGGYFCAGSAYGEFEHLRSIGVVDGREAALASKSIDDRHYTPGGPRRSYDPMARHD